jgi:hypothetical protein
MRLLTQEALAFAQRFADQRNLAMLQVSQAAMNDASGAASRARRKVVLLEQQSALARQRALPRNGNAIDAAANYHDIKATAVEQWSLPGDSIHQ